VPADPAERQPERIACVTSHDVEIPRFTARRTSDASTFTHLAAVRLSLPLRTQNSFPSVSPLIIIRVRRQVEL
jgi:hypothetical protein